MTAARIVNQSIGVGALGCSLDANTVLWGFAIAAVNDDASRQSSRRALLRPLPF
jgi:hypothetical protein